MALVRRLTRLLTADMHALIDRLEAPGIVLRQAVREMESELERQTARAKMLERRIYDAIREQGADNGLTYEKGPQY